MSSGRSRSQFTRSAAGTNRRMSHTATRPTATIAVPTTSTVRPEPLRQPVALRRPDDAPDRERHPDHPGLSAVCPSPACHSSEMVKKMLVNAAK